MEVELEVDEPVDLRRRRGRVAIDPVIGARDDGDAQEEGDALAREEDEIDAV